jgi:threonine/homoserine/homoserine lactone efflux protein
MLDPSALAMPFFASLALIVVPGPAVLYIVTRSVDQGRTAGLASAAGIATGGLVHVAAAALGLSAILASSAVAFSALKYLGAAYLIFLGVRTLLTRPDPAREATRSQRTLGSLFSQGVVVQALNPKVALFFLAFLPQFVDPARGDVLGQTLLLGAMFVVLGLCSDSLYAVVAGSAGDWLKRQPAWVSAQRYVAGSVFIGLGVTTAVSGAKTK